MATVIKNLKWLIPILMIIVLWNPVKPILFLLSISLILMILLNPAVDILESLTKNRVISVLIAVATLFFIIGFGIKSLYPFIYNQAVDIKIQLANDGLVEKVRTVYEKFIPDYFVATLGDDGFNSLFNFINSVGNDLYSMIGEAGAIVGNTIYSFLCIMIFLVFLLLDSEKFKRSFIKNIPNRYFEITLKIIDRIYSQIGRYIRGQFIAASSVAITSIIGLYTLQYLTDISINYIIIIGICAGLFNLIPFLGPIIGMMIAIIIYFTTEQNPEIGHETIHLFLLVLVFAVVQLIDNVLVSPLVLSDSVGIHPLLIIILAMIGGTIAGPLGMILSIPIAVILKVIIEELSWGFENYGYY
tara:strand:+ start:388 stop:1458 length:1071 start_codon:yes stop_codon:yes gene_type:complete